MSVTLRRRKILLKMKAVTASHTAVRVPVHSSVNGLELGEKKHFSVYSSLNICFHGEGKVRPSLQ